VPNNIDNNLSTWPNREQVQHILRLQGPLSASLSVYALVPDNERPLVAARPIFRANTPASSLYPSVSKAPNYII
jgi:hypothetical protein